VSFKPSLQDPDSLAIHLHLDEVQPEAGPDTVGADYSDAGNAMKAEASINEGQGTKDVKIDKDLISGSDAQNTRIGVSKTANGNRGINIEDICKDVKCRGSSRRRRKRYTEGDKIDIMCCQGIGGGGNGGLSSSSGGSSISSGSPSVIDSHTDETHSSESKSSEHSSRRSSTNSDNNNDIDIGDICKDVKCRGSSWLRRKRNTEGDKINIMCCQGLGGGVISGSSSSSGGRTKSSGSPSVIDYSFGSHSGICKNVKCHGSSRRRHKRNTEGDKIDIMCCQGIGEGGN